MKDILKRLYLILFCLMAIPRTTIVTFQTQKILPNDIIHTTYIINAFQDKTEVFHGYYSFPTLPDTIQNASIINSFYQKQFAQHYKEMAELRDSAFSNVLPANNVFAYDHTFEVTFISEHFLSILENTYTYSGGAHPNSISNAHTFSLQTGKELTLSNLFMLPKKEAETYVKESIIQRINANPNDYFPNAVNTVQNESIDNLKFYISQNGVVVFFNPYEIAPYAGG